VILHNHHRCFCSFADFITSKYCFWAIHGEILVKRNMILYEKRIVISITYYHLLGSRCHLFNKLFILKKKKKKKKRILFSKVKKNESMLIWRWYELEIPIFCECWRPRLQKMLWNTLKLRRTQKSMLFVYIIVVIRSDSYFTIL